MKSLEAAVGINAPEGTKSVIRQAMLTPKGKSMVWVIVEDEDDVLVYQRFLDRNKVKILTSADETGHKGCSKLERIVSETKAEETNALIFGIRDTDYTRYESAGHQFHEDVFTTDCRDIEMMMLAAPSVKSALNAWNANIQDNLDKGERIARKFGYMRICNHLRDLGCNFKKKVKIVSAWDQLSHSIRPDWEVSVLNDFFAACNIGFTKEEFDTIVDSLQLETESRYNICQGHDVLNLLQYMMINTQIYNADSIRNKMVAAYSKDDFSASVLHQSISDWSARKNVSILN